LGTRNELRLIDHICFAEDLPFRVCYKQAVNTDHRSIHTSIPLAVPGAALQHLTVRSKKKKRKKSKKFWKPITDATAAAFCRRLEDLSTTSMTLASFH
jgi:hypothetical protein